jgi:hypothetical protein
MRLGLAGCEGVGREGEDESWWNWGERGFEAPSGWLGVTVVQFGYTHDVSAAFRGHRSIYHCRIDLGIGKGVWEPSFDTSCNRTLFSHNYSAHMI